MLIWIGALVASASAVCGPRLEISGFSGDNSKLNGIWNYAMDGAGAVKTNDDKKYYKNKDHPEFYLWWMWHDAVGHWVLNKTPGSHGGDIMKSTPLGDFGCPQTRQWNIDGISIESANCCKKVVWNNPSGNEIIFDRSPGINQEYSVYQIEMDGAWTYMWWMWHGGVGHWVVNQTPNSHGGDLLKSTLADVECPEDVADWGTGNNVVCVPDYQPVCGSRLELSGLSGDNSNLNGIWTYAMDGAGGLKTNHAQPYYKQKGEDVFLWWMWHGSIGHWVLNETPGSHGGDIMKSNIGDFDCPQLKEWNIDSVSVESAHCCSKVLWNNDGNEKYFERSPGINQEWPVYQYREVNGVYTYMWWMWHGATGHWVVNQTPNSHGGDLFSSELADVECPSQVAQWNAKAVSGSHTVSCIEPGPSFYIESYNSVVYNSAMTPEELEEDILHKNPVLNYAKAGGIRWTRGVNADFSNFAGIDWHPGLLDPDQPQVYSIKWTNAFSTYGGPTANHPFKIEVTLMKEDEGTDRCFSADLEVMYKIDWALKIAMKDAIHTSDGTTVNYERNGRTDVETYVMEGGNKVVTGECFRTDAAWGDCSCEWENGYGKDSEGKCVKADTHSTISCEFESDIGNDGEKGSMSCPAGHEIVLYQFAAKLTRADPNICSKGYAAYPKYVAKKYSECTDDITVWDYVQGKCGGQQTCEYKFYDGETPAMPDPPVKGNPNKKYKSTCKGKNRYVTVPYGCSKVITKPSKPPGDPCSSCAETGYTTETDCHYAGVELDSTTQTVPLLLNERASSWEECKAKCEASDKGCVAFTYYDMVGTVNCHLMTGLLNKQCNTGYNFKFSRKCELSPQCNGKEACATSSIPYFVYGPTFWACNGVADNPNKIKECSLSCWEQATPVGQDMKVGATCDSNGEWSLTDSTDPGVLGEFQGGCLQCSGDPNTKHPIAEGGTWECTNELKLNPKGIVKENKKVCVATCPNPKKIIKGALECFRKESMYSIQTASPDAFEFNKQLTNYHAKEKVLSCLWPTCQESDFAGLLAGWITKEGYAADIATVDDFKFKQNPTSFVATMLCPNGKTKSKTKCQCKENGKGKRNFRCNKDFNDELKGC